MSVAISTWRRKANDLHSSRVDTVRNWDAFSFSSLEAPHAKSLRPIALRVCVPQFTHNILNICINVGGRIAWGAPLPRTRAGRDEGPKNANGAELVGGDPGKHAKTQTGKDASPGQVPPTREPKFEASASPGPPRSVLKARSARGEMMAKSPPLKGAPAGRSPGRYAQREQKGTLGEFRELRASRVAFGYINDIRAVREVWELPHAETC